MGEKGPKTYMKNINEKAREREWNLKPSVVLCGVCTFWEKKGALCWQRLCVLCRALFSFLFLFLFFFKVCMYNLVCVCVYILEERSWCSRSLFLLGLGRFSLYRHTRSLWRSLNTRGGCFCERKCKSTNSKARRFRASIGISRWPDLAAHAHANLVRGHFCSMQYFTMWRWPLWAAAMIVHWLQSNFFTSPNQRTNARFPVRAASLQKWCCASFPSSLMVVFFATGGLPL